MAETHQLFNGFRNEPRLPERWQLLARKKIGELDALAQQVALMKDLLVKIQACRCLDLHECGRRILRGCDRQRRA